LELHKSYSGFLPRFNAARALLFTPEGEEKFEMYVNSNVGGGMLSKMLVLTDLEHPLFLKYNFDAQDFMIGAKYSFEAVTSNVIHTSEFRDFLKEEMSGDGDDLNTPGAGMNEEREENDEGDDNNFNESVVREKERRRNDLAESVDFLRSVCTPKAFEDFIAIGVREAEMGEKFVISDEKIDGFYLSRAIISMEDDKDDNHDESLIASDDDKQGIEKRTTSSIHDVSPDVVANITVKFITMCTARLKLGKEDARTWKMLRCFNWTFSGAIDKDRNEMEWKISEVGVAGLD
jgi:hypothetical protein